MRSSKSRSRSKNNRNRSVGNIVNRVFDSSGPEGKVRGTPQQIIEKYNQLARDAQLSNDRVATENFQQHAEHYTRMLSEAQREADARREQQEQQQNRDRDRQRDRDENRNGGSSADTADAKPEQVSEPAAPPDMANADHGSVSGGDVVDFGDGGDSDDSGLVETPESAEEAAPKPRARRTRKPKVAKAPKADGDDAAPAAADSTASDAGDDPKQAAE